ncbi:hypothetical protein J2T18_000251 [Paenibacillus polymyxa]|uniref:hypothetical protein n=1 Tax=Paenibacillus polymyxa TaxID=1406 RepID=UPI002790DE58|nr:hypothetical protein [Paenibacillus polymyxa]MDQ0045979.1 hypothetical protein [Paenibacillus polymyxa]
MASTVFYVMLLGLLFRMESFNQLNGWLRGGRFLAAECASPAHRRDPGISG